MVIFHSYVKLSEGIRIYIYIYTLIYGIYRDSNMDFKGIYMEFIGISLGCYKDFIWICIDFMVISMDNWDNNCDNNWDIMACTLQFMGMIKLLYNWVNFWVYDGEKNAS